MSSHTHPPRRALALLTVATLLAAATACSSTSNADETSTDIAAATSSSSPSGSSTSSPSSPASASAKARGPRPTVVLVHGAWADTSSWDGVIEQLHGRGYDVRAIANPLQDLTTDAEYVADFLGSLTGPVVLVGHSYGGAVITNAAAGYANVEALVYVDASAPDVGEANSSLSGKDSVLNTMRPGQLFEKTPYPGAPPGAAELYLRKQVFVEHFGSDLPEDVATRLWASQRGASTVAFGTKSRYAAWKEIPSWYFISSGDQIITAAAERRMARRAGADVTVFHGGSHLTLVSHPEAVTEVIQDAIDSLG